MKITPNNTQFLHYYFPNRSTSSEIFRISSVCYLWKGLFSDLLGDRPIGQDLVTFCGKGLKTKIPTRSGAGHIHRNHSGKLEIRDFILMEFSWKGTSSWGCILQCLILLSMQRATRKRKWPHWNDGRGDLSSYQILYKLQYTRQVKFHILDTCKMYVDQIYCNVAGI